MSDILANIDLNDINLGDERYKISLSLEDISTLSASIKHTGLITPPLLRSDRSVKQAGKKYIIVSGFKRINALAQNKINSFPALILPSDTSELACYSKAIAAKAFQRPLTHAELILCVKRLTPLCDIETISDRASYIFNAQLSTSFLINLLNVGELPKPALDLIQSGNLSIKSAKKLKYFSKPVILLFLELFSKIKASSSKQLEILTYIKETSAREKIDPDIFLNDSSIQNILSDDDIPPGVKANKLRALLYKKRFPAIFTTRQKIQNSISELKLGSHIKLIPPENFEGRQYTFSFTAKNIKEFEGRIKKLGNACRNDNLKQIFTP